MKNPIEASSEQVNRFAKLIGNNARPLHPLNLERSVGRGIIVQDIGFTVL